MIAQPRFTDEPPQAPPPGDDPVARLRLQLNELQTYIRQQWAARTDRVLLSLRRLAVLAVAGLVGLLALAAWVITAVVMLLQGAAGWLAYGLDVPFWLGSLIVGGAAIVLALASVALVYASWSAASNRKTKQKYERRQREQRRRFGHSAHERATRR